MAEHRSAKSRKGLPKHILPSHRLEQPYARAALQAQKRFRSRQKEHLAESQRAIEDLTAKMAELTAEKQRVDLRNKVLGHLLELTNAQVSDTRALQASTCLRL